MQSSWQRTRSTAYGKKAYAATWRYSLVALSWQSTTALASDLEVPWTMGPFAYIGLMAVHPERQQRGIGRLVLEQILAWLDQRGCPTVLLDATPIGAPLYEHCSFIDDDHTLVLRQKQPARLPRQLPEGVSCFSEQDVPSLVAFDTSCFGAERGALLTSY